VPRVSFFEGQACSKLARATLSLRFYPLSASGEGEGGRGRRRPVPHPQPPPRLRGGATLRESADQGRRTDERRERDTNEMIDLGRIDLGKRSDDCVGQPNKVGEHGGRSLPAQSREAGYRMHDH